MRPAWRRLVLGLVVAALLGGCAKKSDPRAPADQPNTFPRSYPSE